MSDQFHTGILVQHHFAVVRSQRGIRRSVVLLAVMMRPLRTPSPHGDDVLTRPRTQRLRMGGGGGLKNRLNLQFRKDLKVICSYKIPVFIS